MRRTARILSISLITAGLVILLDVGVTLVWKEPISALYGTIQQARADAELDGVAEDFEQLPAVQRGPGQADPEDEARRLAGLFGRTVESGKAIGRLVIPALDDDFVLIEGTGTAPLQKGPGRYSETALPGQGATVAIAGHRTTYLAPFRRIEDLDRGDRISLEMPYGTFDYEVDSSEIVDPDQTDVIADVGRERLVLTTCHPLYSAAERYVVTAKPAGFELASS